MAQREVDKANAEKERLAELERQRIAVIDDSLFFYNIKPL